MATAAQLAQFRQRKNSLVELARRDLVDFWSSLNLSGDPARVRDALLDFFPDLVTAYGDAGALLAADFYDELRNVSPSAARFRAVLASPPHTAQARASARWGVGPLFAEEPDAALALENLAGAAQRLVLQAARDTIVGASRKDPVRTGFARIPSGPTCAFCTMLASRGFVYGSEASAGKYNDWHDKCNCDVVPGRGPQDYPAGYDPQSLRELYKQNKGIGDLSASATDAGEPPSVARSLLRANPNYEKGAEYKSNCANAVTAFEMQMRGLNVEALGVDDASVARGGIHVEKFLSQWKSADGSTPELTRVGSRTAAERALKDAGEGSRSFVFVNWNRSYGGGGHVFSAVNEGGRIRFLDPQSGKEYDADLFSNVKPKNVWFLRSDDLSVKSDLPGVVK